MIIDSHAHYDDEAFEKDRKEVLESLKEAGIEKVIDIGASIASTKRAIALSQEYPFVYAAVGVHPSDTMDLESDGKNFIFLKEACKMPKVVAVGEIGLDYYWDTPEREIQKKWFRKQLQLAKEVSLPVVIHSREAALDTITIMREEKAQEIPGVVHCYSYSKESARDYLDMGYYFGIGGVLTFKNAKKLKEAVEYIPMDRILLETDCPYLAPEPYRGKRNDSRLIPYVVTEIARIKNLDEKQVMEIAKANTQKLFSI